MRRSKLRSARLKARAVLGTLRVRQTKLRAARSKLEATCSKLGVRSSKLAVRRSKLRVRRPNCALRGRTSVPAATYGRAPQALGSATAVPNRAAPSHSSGTGPA